jgi:uncharacterized phage protein gp47/JayE
MAIFVTENGFVKKTYPELKTYYETSFQEIFGDIDLDPLGPFGQLIGLLAKRDADIWDGAEEIYNTRNPNAAEGISLDNISAETGVIRQSATKTVIYDVFLYGNEGTIVSIGNKARQSIGDYTDIDYLLLEDVTISTSFTRYVEIEIDNPGGIGETYTITIDGVPYSYVSISGDDAISIATELKDIIEADSFDGTVSQDGAILMIEQIISSFDISFTANIALNLLASGGDFESEETGSYTVPSNTLNTIVTPISGWDNVNNSSAGITGRNRETDEELRIRRANTLVIGNATEDAIVNAVSNNVVGVSQVMIMSNRTDVTNIDGLPPHSFEVVVVGGDDDDIAQNIWDTMPAGIATYGNVSIIIKDSEGRDQEILFSRPVAKYIWVKVKRDLYDEEIYPIDGDDAIKNYILQWSLTNQPISKDVIRQRLSTPIYQVSGVGDIEIWLDGTASPLDPPTYLEQNIIIAVREYADFAIDRMIVEDLP